MVVGRKIVREGYKMTELGEIPVDWEIRKLGELYPNMKTGSTPSRRKPSYFKGNILWITSGELKTKKIYSTLENITEEAVRDTNLTVYPKGTFFIAITGLEAAGTRGSCGINAIEATTNQSCLSFVPVKNMNNEYIYYWYSLNGENIAFQYAQGTKQQSLNIKIVSQISILCPPLKEQQKIAEILSTVDEQIENTKQKIEKTKELKKGLMQQLLTKGIGHTEFKQTELGEIPVEWEVKSFKDISTVNQGLQIPISKRYTDNPGHRYFYITNQFLKEDGETYFIENPKESVICTKEDILMTRTGNTGIVVSNVEGVFHNNFFKISFDRDIVDKNFLLFYLTSEMIQYKIRILAGSTTIPDLNHGDFYSLPILIPALKEQRKIASILSSVDEQIESYEQEKEKYLALKKGLMQQLLTGKIRVTV